MNTVTQKARYRQAIIKYAEKYGVTKAANRYDVNRQYIYRWKKNAIVNKKFAQNQPKIALSFEGIACCLYVIRSTPIMRCPRSKNSIQNMQTLISKKG